MNFSYFYVKIIIKNEESYFYNVKRLILVGRYNSLKLQLFNICKIKLCNYNGNGLIFIFSGRFLNNFWLNKRSRNLLVRIKKKFNIVNILI